jgi:hypothetical protein
MSTIDVTGADDLAPLRLADLDVLPLREAGAPAPTAAALAVGAGRVRVHWERAGL